MRMQGIPPNHQRMAAWHAVAPRSYTVEHFTNGNTGWRCTVCGKILRLMPGKDRGGSEERASDARAYLAPLVPRHAERPTVCPSTIPPVYCSLNF